MMGWTVLGIAVAVVAVCLVGYGISMVNRLRQAQVKIDEAAAGIDVALTKRYDVLTKLLDITKAYAKHEQDTLQEVIRLRNGMTMQERSEANAKMDEAIGRIQVLAEAYPELKSSENFKQLQISVMDVEEHLQAARRVYNGAVSAFNKRLASFPDSLAGKALHLEPKAFFQAETNKRNDVAMTF